MRSICVLLAIFACVPYCVQASTIVSQNFDQLTVGGSVTGDLGQLIVTNGSVDVFGQGYFSYVCGGATSCLGLNGSSAGTVSTAALDLSPGSYVLSFQLAGSHKGNDTTTTVSLGNLFTKTYQLGSTDVASVSETIDISSHTSGILSFASNTDGIQGAILNNINLSEIINQLPVLGLPPFIATTPAPGPASPGSPVSPLEAGDPEPATALLCSGALILLSCYKRKRGASFRRD